MIIVGRNSTKLETVKAALGTQFPKQKVETVCSEASDVSDANIQSITEKLEQFPVTVLVNNVGMGQGNRVGVEKLEPDLIRKLINVNCTFPTLLTGAVLKSMKRGRALVINVASVAGLVINPFHGLYGASKAFNHSLSLSMSMVYPDIDVLSVCPGTQTIRIHYFRIRGNQHDTSETKLFCTRTKGVRQAQSEAHRGCFVLATLDARRLLHSAPNSIHCLAAAMERVLLGRILEASL